MDEIIKSLDILREDLTEEQMQKLVEISTELKGSTTPSLTQIERIMQRINSETTIDIEKLQKKMGRLRAEAVKNRPPKIGANETCPCGSGKKYKKCCRK